MKITVGRLKTIINEELTLAAKKYKRDEEEPEKEPEEVPAEPEEPAHIQQLKDILEKWEEAEYDSDEERWQAYAEDIQNLVDGEKSEDHTEEECEEVHPDQTHEEWEEGEDKEKDEDKPKKKKEKDKKPKKASKSAGKNFPYESKKLEQMVYQKLLTAFGDKK